MVDRSTPTYFYFETSFTAREGMLRRVVMIVVLVKNTDVEAGG